MYVHRAVLLSAHLPSMRPKPVFKPTSFAKLSGRTAARELAATFRSAFADPLLSAASLAGQQAAHLLPVTRCSFNRCKLQAANSKLQAQNETKIEGAITALHLKEMTEQKGSERRELVELDSRREKRSSTTPARRGHQLALWSSAFCCIHSSGLLACHLAYKRDSFSHNTHDGIHATPATDLALVGFGSPESWRSLDLGRIGLAAGLAGSRSRCRSGSGSGSGSGFGSHSRFIGRVQSSVSLFDAKLSPRPPALLPVCSSCNSTSPSIVAGRKIYLC